VDRHPTPLGDGYREGVLWQEGLREDQREGLRTPTSPTPPAHVDVAVLGGGYCGLAAAAELARRGRSVAVFDRHDLGWGASTRNGGMVLPELKYAPSELAARHGPLGRRLQDEVEDAFDHVEALVADGLECDYERTGQLYLTHGRRGAAHLEQLAADLAGRDPDARVLTGDELRAEAGSRHFAAGLVLARSGGLHPARFHHGLVVRARRAGASLHPGTAVLAVEPAARAGHRLRTPVGVVHAGEVLVATNAAVDGVTPRLAAKVLPMGSFIIATEPLAPELAATVLPGRRMAFNDRNLLWYWRHGPDGRILFGGRRSLGRVTLPEARDHLYRGLLTAHPQLVGTRVERVWGGEVALTVDRLPHCGRLDGLWYATGCNGSGVALNTWLGHRMAGAICGEDPPAFAELSAPDVPLRSLRRLWLPPVGAWMRALDALDR
jgi:glycine/D-amino acid oxidase-like deaminating enzyme